MVLAGGANPSKDPAASLRLALLNHAQHLLATVQLGHAKPTPKGFAFTRDGATARLTLRRGGRVTVKDIPTGAELDLLQTLELPASPATTYQLSADIELHQRDGTVEDGYLNILAIDIEIT